MTTFVFGSNLAGRHGKGAALEAKQKWGAIYGQGVGSQGKSYAIPTKGYHMEVLPLDQIERYVKDFLIHAAYYPQEVFFVTRVGCGLAGYQDHQIAPMFVGAPTNCILPDTFNSILKRSNASAI